MYLTENKVSDLIENKASDICVSKGRNCPPPTSSICLSLTLVSAELVSRPWEMKKKKKKKKLR